MNELDDVVVGCTGVGVSAPDATRSFEDLGDGAAITRFISSTGQLVGAVALDAPLAARATALDRPRMNAPTTPPPATRLNPS